MNMKKLAILTLAIFAAVGAAQAEVKIKGKNEQSVKVKGAVLNAAIGAGATAKQNLSSNAGQVTIGGDNKQTTDVTGAVLNAAIGAGTTAKQNLASNTSDK
jgi:uncharacterized protein YcfL